MLTATSRPTSNYVYVGAGFLGSMTDEQTVCEYPHLRPLWPAVNAGVGAENLRPTVDRNVGDGPAAADARPCPDIPEPNTKAYSAHQRWRNESKSQGLEHLW